MRRPWQRLGTRRFHRALEVGCSIGVLTERLAGRCDQVVGVDFVAAAVASARARCAPYPGLSIEQMQVPQQWPEGRFDLILFSEVLYFLNESDLTEICAHTGAFYPARRAGPPGELHRRDGRSL